MRNNEKRQLLGILGGLGPMASAYFYEMITEHTAASCDQEHIDIILSSRATTPDRTAYILGESDATPLDAMIEDARSLEQYGATAIVVPCNTAHYFIDAVRRSVSVPMPSIITETVRHIKKCGFQKPVILATVGTVSTHTYQRELEENGMDWAIPDEAGQAAIMDIIYGKVKSGEIPEPEVLYNIVEPMFASGCDCAILGCTELSLIGRKMTGDDRIVDSLTALAACAIQRMGHKSVGFPESYK